MKNSQKTDEEIKKIMVDTIKEGTFNKASNFLGSEVMKKHGLTKDNINMQKILEIAKKEKMNK